MEKTNLPGGCKALVFEYSAEGIANFSKFCPEAHSFLKERHPGAIGQVLIPMGRHRTDVVIYDRDLVLKNEVGQYSFIRYNDLKRLWP